MALDQVRGAGYIPRTNPVHFYKTNTHTHTTAPNTQDIVEMDIPANFQMQYLMLNLMWNSGDDTTSCEVKIEINGNRIDNLNLNVSINAWRTALGYNDIYQFNKEYPYTFNEGGTILIKITKSSNAATFTGIINAIGNYY